MDPIEKAIRAAIEKGNPEDGIFRQKIYGSAELALARSLSTRAGMDEQTRHDRLAHLYQVVASIETEFTPATAPIVSVGERPETKQPEPAFVARKPSVQEPRLEAIDELRWSRTPNSGHGDNDDSMVPYGRIDKQSEISTVDDSANASNGLFRKLVTTFVFITILALLVMFGWSAWNSSLFGNGTDNGAGPAKLSQSEDSSDGIPPQLGSGNAQNENWISVFEPKDASSVQASEGLTAELRGNGDGSYLNIANTTNSAQGEAIFEIGRGVLETMRGKKIVFNVQAKTTDGLNTQMAASCSLAGMGECQRVRFRLEGQLSENLVIVQLSDAAPEASGTLTIVPDIDKTGNPVEIIAIRVRVEQ